MIPMCYRTNVFAFIGEGQRIFFTPGPVEGFG